MSHVQIEGRPSDRASLYLGSSCRLHGGLLTERSEPYLGVEAGLRWFLRGSAGSRAHTATSTRRAPTPPSPPRSR
ncbi:MAG TPA: hypothetical protein ENK18_27295 [Deltaproteobacteria bacterium]|nr:hypothetical protein [Deltaproteobacteria bacterium]